MQEPEDSCKARHVHIPSIARSRVRATPSSKTNSICQTSRTQQSGPNDGLKGTRAHRGRLGVEKRAEKVGWMGMTTKSGKSRKAKSASGNGESGAATTPSDDDERLNLSASLRDAHTRPLIQLANLAPQRLRKPKHDSGKDLEAPPFDRPCQGLMDVEATAPSP